MVLRAVRARTSGVALGGRLAKNTMWGMASEIGRLASGLLVFFILTLRFDVADYGRLIGALAVMRVLLPTATIGSSYLLLERVAGKGWNEAVALRQALGVAIAGGTAVTGLLILVQPVLLPQVSIATLGLLGLSELALVGAIEACVFLAQAQERLQTMAAIRTSYGITRLMGAGLLLAFTTSPELWIWALIATVAGVVSVVIAQLSLLRSVVVPAIPTWADVKSGIPFSVGFSAEKLRSGADEFMLVRLDQEVDAGLYGAANRLLGAATVPIRALLHASNARFYEAGSQSVRAGHRLAIRLSLAALWWAVPLGLGIALVGPIVVGVLPAEYADTGDVLRWMAILPALRVLQIFGATALTGAGYHGYRVRLMISTAVANIAMNAVWIPDHGWRGAIAATIVSSVLYVLGVWATLTHLARKDPRPRDGDREKTVT